jgi:hypothetical protein
MIASPLLIWRIFVRVVSDRRATPPASALRAASPPRSRAAKNAAGKRRAITLVYNGLINETEKRKRNIPNCEKCLI